ncbi:hypothetical protein D3C79_1101280 [compost metagenome]
MDLGAVHLYETPVKALHAEISDSIGLYNDFFYIPRSLFCYISYSISTIMHIVIDIIRALLLR